MTLHRAASRGLVVMVVLAVCAIGPGAQAPVPSVFTPPAHIRTLAMSRDGRLLLFVGSDDARNSRTWLKDLRTGRISAFEVPDQPSQIFRAVFSPDGRWLAFVSRDTLRRVPVSGGPSVKICDASGMGSFDWGDDGRIVFVESPLNPAIHRLWRVPAFGGTPAVVAEFNEPNEHLRGLEDVHVLPGSRAALLTRSDLRTPATVIVQPLDGGPARVVLRSASHARYLSSNGHLVYAVGDRSLGDRWPAPLAVVPFDPRTLRVTGSEARLDLEARAGFAVSSSGALAHVAEPVELVRIYRDGRRMPLGTLPDSAGAFRISPDGRRVVFVRNGLWTATIDNLRDTTRRLTHDASDHSPVWSPDSRRLAFSRHTDEPVADVWDRRRGIHAVVVDGGAPPQRLALHGDGPVFWSAATGRVGYQRSIPGVGGSLWTTAPGEGTSRLVLRAPETTFMSAALSRDGKWLAFKWTRSSKEDWRTAFTYIYVAPFTSGGRPTEMPFLDAYNPVWSSAGDELFFERSGWLLVTRVNVDRQGMPSFGEPAVVREPRPGYRHSGYDASAYGDRQYDVMPDAGSVLVNESLPPEIVVLPNVVSRRIQ